ncbi:rhamnulose-1-phosphate aldolase [Desulfosarcina ovata subsp. ovata]|uniref:Rhamnulose-1-phosphate aldolase n=2 Tax=Desulfosarcina ovata TaxID=83564 RepID=A0A5K8ALE4_9BACT|nr:rhamnulose-1-phosphate aldolase [Desulfosarcina ovata subsp. ovata]
MNIRKTIALQEATQMNVTDAPFVRGFIRLTDDAFKKGWHERNGGNLSYRIRPEEIETVRSSLRDPAEWTDIGLRLPDLAGEYFLVTGSGKYMRNVIECPADNIAIALIDEAGEKFSLVWGLESGGRPTSEFPTHLINHAITAKRTNGAHHVIYHAHPANIIALSFVLPLTDRAFTRELWGMATECPVVFPEGVGVVPWMVPGGSEIAKATGKLMEQYNVVVWAHHGVFCSGADFDETFGLMDTVEKSAEISVKVRSMGGAHQGIAPDELRHLASDFNVTLPEKFFR